MNKIKILCALSLILTLSACSSSGGGGGGGGAAVVPIDLSEAPGIDGPAIEDSTLVRRIEAALDRLEAETMDGGSLTALGTDALPSTGTATLNGYIRFGGRAEDEIIVGNLRIVADFNAGATVPISVTAEDFTEFDTSDPANPVALDRDDLIHSGYLYTPERTPSRITGTSFTSGLDGTLLNKDGSGMHVAANLKGRFYEDEGRLIAYGEVLDSSTASLTRGSEFIDTPAFTSGEFAASGAIEPSE